MTLIFLWATQTWKFGVISLKPTFSFCLLLNPAFKPCTVFPGPLSLSPLSPSLLKLLFSLLRYNYYLWLLPATSPNHLHGAVRLPLLYTFRLHGMFLLRNFLTLKGKVHTNSLLFLTCHLPLPIFNHIFYSSLFYPLYKTAELLTHFFLINDFLLYPEKKFS